MKPIKICKENSQAIEAALKAVNGTATAHTYTSYDEIQSLAETAENRSNNLLGSKKAIIGAKYSAISGDKVPNAYAKIGFHRVATNVVLLRKTACWYLIDVVRKELFRTDAGGVRLIFTKAQAEAAIAVLNRNFSVAQGE